ncbi:MAG: hypothetical protein WBI82_17300 [Sphaerochaeta sp.]
MTIKPDYSQVQTEAARRILIEVMNILEEYKEDMRVVGGWVPDLYYPERYHVRSIDVDVLLNHVTLAEKDPGYLTIDRILKKNGFIKDSKSYFKYIKTISIKGMELAVDLDMLAGKYGGKHGTVSQHVSGLKALPATGGNYAFDYPAFETRISGTRPDGASDSAIIQVIDLIPFLVMKTSALGRGKSKDAYDIYFILKNYTGGPSVLAKRVAPIMHSEIIHTMLIKLSAKFESPKHAGPIDVADFLDEKDEEIYAINCQDAFQVVQAFLYPIFSHI